MGLKKIRQNESGERSFLRSRLTWLTVEIGSRMILGCPWLASGVAPLPSGFNGAVQTTGARRSINPCEFGTSALHHAHPLGIIYPA